MLTVSLLVCSVVALARAQDNTTEEVVAREKISEYSDTWTYFDGKNYLFDKTEREWSDAEKNCLSKNAHLTSVKSEEEYKFVQNLVKLFSGKDTDTWIGSSDCQKKNVWFWTDGTTFGFDKWSSDADLSDGTCVRMNYGSDKGWDSTVCTELKPSVCSKSAQDQ